MATINFSVGVPDGAPTGYVDGEDGYISTYLAQNVSGYTLNNNIIFCIQPDLLAANGTSTYTVLSGVQGTSLSANQYTALEGIFSKYYIGGDTSFTTQETTMLADWLVVNPKLVISGVDSSIVNNAQNLANEALADGLGIDPKLDFQTFVSLTGNQSFVNIYDPSATPLPPSVGMFMMAIAILFAVSYKKSMSK